ncbi:glycoside hydrolase/phage tail family protein [Mesorhizobium sp. DCY119]|uniref:baseplate multidomain protein megatron n=1 Tax=Mesorhizobium sp. DCY119 TaxID=2108445 RepID=UPI000E6C1098|nr:glycoside hydrolase/phage tail family protein [Mesorhizobium sp. DCY119]RJG46431.1 hypothetical protein D3Y55_20770 [Mesorhizobium sp. DCY119]
MATVVLGLAGGFLAGPVGSTAFLVGQAIGGLVGSFADQAIVSALTPTQRRQGPRLTTTDIQTSTEGSVINRIYGRARTAGQVIWATRFEEVVTKEKSGGKGFGGGAKVETTTYSYYGNFAVGLCQGPVAGVGRIWADGKEVDQEEIEFRVHTGTETQAPDPLIEAKEGAAPAYRGLCYIVFERMDLTNYGNRLPQITAEVFRPVGDLEPMVRGVAVIPGNEHGLDTEYVHQVDGPSENRHTLAASTDIVASIDRLQMVCPSIRQVMLVVSWFGDDLRAGTCSIRPKIESRKRTRPHQWRVSALTRDTATIVSYVDGKPAYGGTPDDASVIRCIRMLKARGLDVMFLPFMMMDVPPGNSLPDPYSNNAGASGQPAFPWRGRITCSPAASFAGSPDKTATAGTQVSAFVGTAAPGHFGGSGTTVTYSGPAEWSYRRFVLHNAKLAQLAGGVESFLIGSEMVGLSTVRSSASAYPFVTALAALAGDVRSIVGAATKISYAADWSEYHSHRPGDGSGDVFFHLDPLWSNANIDFIGIDNYLPLSDWRDGSGHLDFNPAGPATIYDQAYLRSNVEGGEHYAWYYASKAARDAQTRAPIADGAYNEPFVYRNKDIRGWWSNAHRNRPGGVRSGAATAWTPMSKPIRFTEMGCGAVDKGANQPNIFPDRISSEGGLPWYSTRARDDQMQRSWLQAMIGYYNTAANNPVSSVYGGRMIDLARSNIWAWDSRPWPSFPISRNFWGDWQNWQSGHWLSGRMGAAPAPETIRTILDEAGFGLRLIEPIPGVVDGITVGNVISPRSLLDSLRPAYQFDAVESDGVMKFLARHGRAPVATITADELVINPDSPDAPRFRRTRAQETELPDAIKIKYGDQARDDQAGSSEARRSSGGSQRVVEFSPPVVMADTRAREIAELELHAAWVGRERYAFTLPPSRLAIDPGDVIAFAPSGHPVRVDSAGEAQARRIEAFEIDPLAGGTVDSEPSAGAIAPVVSILQAEAVIADTALLRDEDAPHAPYVAGLMSPFRSGVALWRSPAATGFELDTLIPVPGAIGETIGDVYSGPTVRWDRVNSIYVDLKRGTLTSASELAVLNGANAFMIENQVGEWEVLQFATATPIGGRSWVLTDLLRGQRGTEHAMRDPVPAGARVLVLDQAVGQASVPASLIGMPLNWRVGAADRGVSDPGVSQSTITLRGRGRRPLSPVHLRATRQTNGDFLLKWIRRTRIGGDSWDAAEVPLGEEFERYEIEILNGASVARTVLGLGAPAWLYRVADQAADFGGPITSIAFRVHQISATFGRGIPGTFP